MTNKKNDLNINYNSALAKSLTKRFRKLEDKTGQDLSKSVHTFITILEATCQHCPDEQGTADIHKE